MIWPVPPEVRRELKHLRESTTELRDHLTDHNVARDDHWDRDKNDALDNVMISISRLLAVFGE
jgi:hypothetical protein